MSLVHTRPIRGENESPADPAGTADRSSTQAPVKLLHTSCVSTHRSWTDSAPATCCSGQHDGPVKEVFVLDEMNMVVSGSWDRTLRPFVAIVPAAERQLKGTNTTVNSNPQGFWNLQQPTPVATLQLPERFLDTNVTAVNIQKQGQTISTSAYHHTMRVISGVYTMDVKYPLLVVGCAERHVPLGCTSRISRNWKGSWVKRRLLRLVYNLQAIQQNPAPYKQGQTALKMQTRAICSPAALSPHAHA